MPVIILEMHPSPSVRALQQVWAVRHENVSPLLRPQCMHWSLQPGGGVKHDHDRLNITFHRQKNFVFFLFSVLAAALQSLATNFYGVKWLGNNSFI